MELPPASIPGPPSHGDWHHADVIAELKKRGHNLAGLAIANGYHPTSAGKALKKSWPAMEHIIAAAIGVAPEAIWPTRYSAGDRPVIRHVKPPASRADSR